MVVPGGEAPSLKRFLSLHRQLYRIADTRAIDPNRIRWCGVVDTCRKDRLGVAADWPAMADHVVVFDHHMGRECDIKNDKRLDLFVEPVGAVATLIAERLRAAGKTMTPAEATLLALAIHSDTGSLIYENSTARDAEMLAWLMGQGAIQRSIAEFSHSSLTDEQQVLLSRGLSDMKKTASRGVQIASVMLVGNNFVKGMSSIATDLLDLSNADVFVLTYVNCRGRSARKRRKPVIDEEAEEGTRCGPDELKQVSVICRSRARVDGVDFRELLRELSGGGHARAASASLKLTEADAVIMTEALVQAAIKQIPDPPPVSEFMTTEVSKVLLTATLLEARSLMKEGGHGGLPVVSEGNVLAGLITIEDINNAEHKSGDDALRRPVSGWMRQKALSLPPDTPLYVAEQMIVEAGSSVGLLPVVTESGELVGVVSRTDVLVQRRMWHPATVASSDAFDAGVDSAAYDSTPSSILEAVSSES